MLTALSVSNGNGFANIEVGGFQAALIQAADGEFVSHLYPPKQLHAS